MARRPSTEYIGLYLRPRSRFLGLGQLAQLYFRAMDAARSDEATLSQAACVNASRSGSASGTPALKFGDAATVGDVVAQIPHRSHCLEQLYAGAPG